MRSLAGSFSLVCSFYALSRLPVGDVVTLTSTYPLWILVLSVDREPAGTWAGRTDGSGVRADGGRSDRAAAFHGRNAGRASRW